MRYQLNTPTCLGASMLIGLALPQTGAAAVRTIRIASGLSRPVFVTSPPGDAQRQFVLEQHVGRIRIIKDGTLLPTAFLTVAGVTMGNEQGLLGLAFHPQYASNRRFYIYYTTTGGGPAGQSIVAEYQASAADPDLADAGSARVILHFDQPQSNHNAGWIGFGPNDGYLYIASGDGGGTGDDDAGHTVGTGNGQDTTDNWLGKILRIDVNGDDFPADSLRNYAIPAANPFAGVPGDDEIWAYGLRNPWRCAFDRANGDFYIADVGQGAWEEVNYQPAASTGGQNYGWRLKEGFHCFNPSTNCDPGGLTDPVHEYSHTQGCSITGGIVYRGSIPEIQGVYFFADHCSDQIWSFRIVGGAVTELTERTAEMVPGGSLSILSISSFGEDADSEMYICDLDGGEVFKVVSDADGDGVPDLSDLCPNTIEGVTVDANGCPPLVPGDIDRDGDVDADDLDLFALCASGPGVPDNGSPTCQLADLDPDGDVDQSDFSVLQRCLTAPNDPGDPNCAN
ncbi:MAG: PQQ-dependent sugar dehydrogenase [Phycisphaerae bacterium]|nr:PQQ-dependent sugar dehydrogenase [Phycisphaerae bacterium]